MRLWGGDSDTGCCSVADVDDARRVAQQLDIDHLVFNFSDEFNTHVVDPYVRAHSRRPHAEPVHRVQSASEVRSTQRARRSARVRCDRHRSSRPRRERSAIATSSIAAPMPQRTRATSCTCCRSANCAARCFRSGTSPRRRSATGPPRSVCERPRSPTAKTCASSRKPAAARRSSARGSRSARGPSSTRGGTVLGEVPAIEMVTLGQRRGIGLPGGGPKRYVTHDRPRHGDRRRRRRVRSLCRRASASAISCGPTSPTPAR